MAVVARCTKCGSLDTRATYTDAVDAADMGALSAWTCSTCAWTEFELVGECTVRTLAPDMDLGFRRIAYLGYGNRAGVLRY